MARMDTDRRDMTDMLGELGDSLDRLAREMRGLQRALIAAGEYYRGRSDGISEAAQVARVNHEPRLAQEIKALAAPQEDRRAS